MGNLELGDVERGYCIRLHCISGYSLEAIVRNKSLCEWLQWNKCNFYSKKNVGKMLRTKAITDVKFYQIMCLFNSLKSRKLMSFNSKG